jgi:hypothetical protein
MLTCKGYLRMNIPSNKKKLLPAQNKVLKNKTKKSDRNASKTKFLNKKIPPNELLELTQTWEDDLCE